MEVPRDPFGVLLAGLSLLNDGTNVQCTYAPLAGDGHRWTVAVGSMVDGRTTTGPTLLEAVTNAYRGSVADLEGAVQRQVNAALERE